MHSSREGGFSVASSSVDQGDNFDDRMTRVVSLVELLGHYISFWNMLGKVFPGETGKYQYCCLRACSDLIIQVIQLQKRISVGMGPEKCWADRQKRKEEKREGQRGLIHPA